MNLTNVPEPLRLEAHLVSADFFSVLGVPAPIGRTLALGEDREEGPAVVVISDRLAKALGPAHGVVGRRITLNASPATVIGVMPRDFHFPSSGTDVWSPLSMSARNRGSREGRWLRVIGRLRPGISAREAAAEMDVVASRLAAAWPVPDAGWEISKDCLAAAAPGSFARYSRDLRRNVRCMVAGATTERCAGGLRTTR